MSLQYQGDDMPLSLMFGEQYTKMNDCQGWCRLPEHRRVAMCVFCDMSKEFGVAIRSDEEGEGVQTAPIPTERGKTVVYQEGSKHLKATEHLLVACCYDIGSYLIRMRRRIPAKRITDDEWRTLWEDLKKCGGKMLRNMCNPQPKVERNREVTAVYYNCISYHKKQADAGVVKATNCVMLHQMDFGKDIPSVE